jgi:Globin
MFHDVKSQANFLVAFFSFAFTAFDNPTVYNAKLNHLAEIHALRGVKTVGKQ